MRDMLRGYATAVLESAASAGHARRVVTDMTGFSRALVESELLRNVLTDTTIPPRTRRSIVQDLLETKAVAESQALASWAALIEPAIDFPTAVVTLVELAEQSAEAADSGVARPIPPEDLLGGRTAVRERIRGYADRMFQEVDRLELIDEIEDELVRFTRVVDSSRRLRRALGDPSTPVAQRVSLVEDLLKAKVHPATERLVAYMMKAGHIRDLVGTLEWVASLAAEERGRRVARVRSAVELDQSECARLAEALERTVGHPVEVRVQVEPSLMGGMAVAIGDTVIDGSVRHRLDQLRGTLAPSAASRDLSGPDHENS
ncbi:MAG: ATP synthase F1 subunit delta [Acidimicrobiales bacterium]|jgi:F-type H+-transporting ATPase subunit delta